MNADRVARRRAWVWLIVVLLAAAVGAGIYAWRLRGRASAPAAAEAKQLWTCPMHPSVIRSEPGQCPICGMDLVPLKQEQARVEESGVEGHGIVQIDPEKQQLLGVRTVAVERRPVGRVVRTVGIVATDEARQSEVQSKVSGWVEKLYVDKTGDLVKRGQPLLTIYSPDLVSTQEEYLVALRARDRLKASPFAEVRESGESLVRRARERLRLWDISEREIEDLETTGKVRKALTLYAPAGGYVLEKHVVEGMQVGPGMSLYRLADLSRVWVEAAVYEFEAPLVKVGQQARLTLAAQPGRIFQGRVAYIYPTVEATTRTLKARLEYANPALVLKPGMYADVEIAVPMETTLAIPVEAVLDSGARKVVFVEEKEGRFAPREVTLGPRAADYYPVLAGLEEGERIVASPNFLIDSESQFQAALEAMRPGASEHAGHGR